MTYTELLDSEWVFDDSLTAKLIVTVRPNVQYSKINDVDDLTVPASSLSDNLQSFLDNSATGDVHFIVQGESIAAHSQILSARSDVFSRQFSNGMQESVTKEVVIDDCDPVVFKAFLRFLYSDNFECLDTVVEEKRSDPYFDDDAIARVSINDSSVSSHEVNRQEKLQQLLAISHKYQINRLQIWCEASLCKRISLEGVCSTLCQAHLFEAKRLEEKCLDFIKANMNDVVKTDSFGWLSQDWPQVSLKIILHNASVPKANATTAIEKQQNARKRKREE
jgi:speckle-type POZ protein